MSNGVRTASILGLLKEASTYRGLALIGTLVGVNVDPAHLMGIVNAGLGVMAFLHLLPDTLAAPATAPAVVPVAPVATGDDAVTKAINGG